MLIPTLSLLLGVVGPPPAEASADSLPVAVRLEGVRGEVQANVQANLRLSREARAGRTLSEAEVNRLHSRAPDQIRSALEPFGFYQPEIESELRTERGAWRATYRIRTGNPVLVSEVEIHLTGEGAEDSALRSAAAAFPLSEGDAFSHAPYEQGKRRLQAATMERGYLDAVFGERQVRVDPADGTAAIRLRLDTGPFFRFGPVRFVGDELEESFLQGFVGFERGDPAATPELLDLQNALQASGLFASVEVELLREEAVDREVPVEVRLVPRPGTRYDAGLGYGTDTGPRAVLGGELRRLNQAGHSLESEIRTSLVRNGLNARYLVPLPGAPGDRLAVSVGILDERTLDVRSTRAQLGVGWHRKRGEWRESWLLDLQRERSGEGDEIRTSHVVLPSVQWTRTEVDDPVHPTRGHRLHLELAASHRVLASPVSFGRLSTSAALIRSPWEGGRVLVRAEAGTAAVEETTALPVSHRFYAGGDRSVRGYAYRSLAPRSPDDSPLGGRHLLVASGEVEQLLWREWGAAVFVDTGNAGDAWPVRPRVGVGGGLRWLSPVGTVGVDAAAAVSRPGTPWRIHLSVGAGL